jgi:hypothetical protein
MTMLHTAEIEMATSVAPSDIATFLTIWHGPFTKASPGAAIFGRDVLFDIPYIADWNKIGDYMQRQTDLNTKRKNNSRIDYDYKVGGKVLLRKDGILCKTESRHGTIRVKRGSKSERLNIRQVTPFFE